jgi:hypothetical protein
MTEESLTVALAAAVAGLVDLGAELGDLGSGFVGGVLCAFGPGALLITGGDQLGVALVQDLPFPAGRAPQAAELRGVRLGGAAGVGVVLLAGAVLRLLGAPPGTPIPRSPAAWAYPKEPCALSWSCVS